jgi:hypothetical protein
MTMIIDYQILAFFFTLKVERKRREIMAALTERKEYRGVSRERQT